MLSCDKRLRENKSWKRRGTENWCRWVGCSRVVGHLKGERDTNKELGRNQDPHC